MNAKPTNSLIFLSYFRTTYKSYKSVKHLIYAFLFTNRLLKPWRTSRHKLSCKLRKILKQVQSRCFLHITSKCSLCIYLYKHAFYSYSFPIKLLQNKLMNNYMRCMRWNVWFASQKWHERCLFSRYFLKMKKTKQFRLLFR